MLIDAAMKTDGPRNRGHGDAYFDFKSSALAIFIAFS
jgi:hypothetical protein